MSDSSLPKVAAIFTEYRPNSHADVIVSRLLGDWGYTPRVRVASLYADQLPPNDMSREAASRHGIPLCATIREAVLAEGGVDGIVLVGEHGDYPLDPLGRIRYPRRRFFEEALAALDELGRVVPIFCDKHLAWQFADARWMYEQIRKRHIPFLGGSSIPHTDAVPPFDPARLRGLHDIVVVSSGGLESYGFHAMDLLQSLAERRTGGESGIRAVRALSGAAVWQAMDAGEWPEELLLQALAAIPAAAAVHPRRLEAEPVLFALEYADGARGWVVQFERLIEKWAFAFRDDGGRIAAARCESDDDRPFAHFERLTRMIETLVLTGRPPFPMERTLMSTGMIYYALEALYAGGALETPQLAIVYGLPGQKETTDE
ncbi:MAG: hypothetical protein J7639_26280 [Paenibacillaceae bacterium]|nr:hypothetical protein [Paenibacillaceae bacterium]